jgi:hypothetical protein
MIDDELTASRARSICHRVICGRAPANEIADLATDPDLAAEVSRRLDACGLRLALVGGRYLVTGDPDLRHEVPEHSLSEPQTAALAHLYMALVVAPHPDGESPRPRVDLRTFCREFGAPRGWSIDHVRRLVIGALSTAEYVRVVAPQGHRREAYVEAGPRMELIDRTRLMRLLERVDIAARTDEVAA